MLKNNKAYQRQTIGVNYAMHHNSRRIIVHRTYDMFYLKHSLCLKIHLNVRKINIRLFKKILLTKTTWNQDNSIAKYSLFCQSFSKGELKYTGYHSVRNSTAVFLPHDAIFSAAFFFVPEYPVDEKHCQENGVQEGPHPVAQSRKAPCHS